MDDSFSYRVNWREIFFPSCASTVAGLAKEGGKVFCVKVECQQGSVIKPSVDCDTPGSKELWGGLP